MEEALAVATEEVSVEAKAEVVVVTTLMAKVEAAAVA